MKSTRKKFSGKITILLLTLFMIVGSSQFAFAATGEDGVQSVRALTDMGWWGQRVVGVVLEFSENVDASALTAADFAVRDTSFNPYFDSGDFADPSFMKDQKVVDVFTVADPQTLLENERPAGPGKYVVVMVEPSFNGGTKISVNGGMMANPNQPTEIIISKDIYSTSGDLLAKASADPLKLTGPAIVNRGVDQFVHGVVENPTEGLPLNYDYRLPADYNPARKYALVVYLNGYGQGYFPAADNTRGQLICDGTLQFWFGEQNVPVSEDVIFLAPQSTRSGQSTAVQSEQIAELIGNFSKEFSVDTDRIYGYSLSMGSSQGWWLLQNHPDLFAAFIQNSFMPNNQEQADAIAAAEIPMQLFQGEYDHLFGSENAIASYQRIADAYKAKGLNDNQIDKLIKITVFPDSAFEAQGPGLNTPSGPLANLNPDLPGPRIDRHASMVPAFQNPETSKWLLAQSKALKPYSEEITQGPTIVADPTSPTGYFVTFVYHNPDAEQVKLAGDLTLLDSATGGATRLQPEEWETGMYHVGGVEFLRDMTKDEDGNWSVTIPMHAGALSYWYRVWDSSQDWENHRIWDPASEKPRPEATDENSTPFRVRNNSDVLDAVYVPYDEKQNDATLESRATYQLPIADASKRGTVQYIPYTTILGDEGFNLGIYLPAGYDANREEPYNVVYAAHGIFGDETDWMIPGSAPNILDNMIARGEIEPTILVTMGNHFSDKSLGFSSYNVQNASDNLVKVILPKIEAEYNVSDERTGRAYIGFSMGGMTGAYVMSNYANTFGYYGFFSGNGRYAAEDYDNIAAMTGDDVPFVFMGRGCFEGDLTSCNAIRDEFRSRGIPSETVLVPGAHDMMTAAQQFTIFAKDYLWEDQSKVLTPYSEEITQGPTIVADPTSPTGYFVTFVYHNPDAEQVKLAGDLTLLDSATGGATRLQPEEWKTGMYHSGGVEFLRDMTKDEDGNWSVTIPLHAGGLSYWYRVWDSSQDWENHRILDPTYKSNMSPDPFRVYNNNDVLGVVYVPYDEKQNDATLESRATYELPIEDLTKKGTVHFDPYTNVLGGTGYLGIYLPAGYDVNRAEPYKVVYLAHGVFGDETDWMGAGNAPNILDNMIARGEIEPTIIVTMGNQINNGKYNYLDTDDQGAATNLVKYIIPYMEANYNVSTKSEDRAYGGFSGGAFTGVTILNKYHDEFGYYGLFSGMGTPDYTVIADENAPFVMTSNGSFEAKSTYDSMKNMHDNFIANGISSVYNIAPGAHDLMMAGQQFTFFAKNCLWK